MRSVLNPCQLKARTLVLALGLSCVSLLGMPRYANAQGQSLNDAVLDLPITRGQSFKVRVLLERWGRQLGHPIVPDKTIAETEIRFLTVESRLTWGLFKAVLSMNGIVVVEEEVNPGRFLIRAHVQRNLANAESSPFLFKGVGEELPEHAELATALIQIKHGAGNDIFTAVRNLQTRDRRRVGTALYVQGPEVIILVDFAPNVTYYEKLLKAIDVKAPAQSLTIRKLKWSLASETAQILQQILQPAAGTATPTRRAAAPRSPQQQAGNVARSATAAASSSAPQAQIIAHDPTNQLIIRAFDYQLAEIEQLIAEVDVRVRSPGPKFHVYKCKDADAEELAGKLTELFTGQVVSLPSRNTGLGNNRNSSLGNNRNTSFGNNRNTSFGNTRNSGFGNTRNSGFGNTSLGNNRNSSLGNNRNTSLGNNNRNSTRNRNTNRNSPGGANSGNGGLNVRMIPDELTNSILVQAEEDDYIVVLRLLRELDRKKRRVVIQGEVWEIAANDDLLISTELASTQTVHEGSIRPLGVTSFAASTVSADADNIRFARGPGSLSISAAGAPSISLGQGLTAFVTRDEIDKIPILLSTLQGSSKARRVTAPFTLTNDNEQATFRTVEQQPFSTTTVNNVASQQNVQFVDAESTLTVNPTVNNDDSLTLQVELIISSFGARSSPTLPPSTNSREYSGTVTVPNGKFVVFGGLNSQSTSYVESKLPLLGDIPILGFLFKSWRRSETLTKLYVFIRPVIFSSTQFRQDIQSSAALLKQAHIETEQERWIPSILPGGPKRDDGELQDKVFELFGTGSANPFTQRP